MKIAVTGHRGRIGSHLTEHYDCAGLDSDITNFSAIFKEINHIRPDVIINCAAYTDVDKSWDNRDESYAVNVFGVEVLSRICNSMQIKLVHLSTSFVFSGKQNTPYKEDSTDFISGSDEATPYARHKLLSEQYAKETINHLIIRLISPYGDGRNNDPFYYVYNSLIKHYDLPLSTYYMRNFSHIWHICHGIYEAAKMDINGILHIASKRVTNYYDFGMRIANTFGLDVSPIRFYNGEIPYRPVNAGLSVHKAEGLGVPIYSLSDGLELQKRIMDK